MNSQVACKFGASCYRRSEQHLRDFSHPLKRQATPPAAAVVVNADVAAADAILTTSPTKRRRVDDNDDTKTNTTDDDDDTSDSDWLDVDAVCALSLSDRMSVWQSRIKQMYGVTATRTLLLTAEFAFEYHRTRTRAEWTRDSAAAAMRLTDDVRLVGPFDVLCGRFDERRIRRRCNVLLHYRYTYDTPESMTFLLDDKDKRHFAEWRDDPRDDPPFVVAIANDSAHATVAATDAFQLIYRLTFQKGARTSADELLQLRRALISFAERHSIPLLNGRNGTLLIPTREAGYIARKKKVVSDSLTGVGIVVPYDPETDVGFRPMPIQLDKLKSLVQRMNAQASAGETVNYDEIDGLTNLIAYANDECDPGCGLLFWMNVYTMSRVLERDAATGLALAYRLLGRELYAQIIMEHVKHRQRHESQLQQADTHETQRQE